MKSYIILLFPFLLVSCTDHIDLMHKKLMNLHDESMLKMSELSKYQKLTKDLYPHVYKDLEKAEEDMWTWMHIYEEPSKEISKEEKMAYYEDQYEKMLKVDFQIDKSISAAKKMTNE